MSVDGASDQSSGPTNTPGENLKGLLWGGVLIVVLAAILFISSGRLDWAMAWVYIVIRAGIAVVSTLIALSSYPGLMEERLHPGGDAKAWDKPLTGVTTLLWPVTLIVAGLDVRFGWSSSLALAIRLVALVVLALGDAFSKWAAASNKFYSRIVRVQQDRGHAVVTGGPYRYVRHPGYIGAIMSGFATPVMLGSLWALLAAGLSAMLLIIRTALEDKTLHEELPGYVEYAQRTRYRLLPGVW